VTGSFRAWERAMFVFVFANLLTIPLFFLAHPHAAPIAHDLFVPGIAGGINSTSVLLNHRDRRHDGRAVGSCSSSSPNIIDKRITPRWINYERLDTWIGAFVVVTGAAALLCVSGVRLPQGQQLLRHVSPTPAAPPTGCARRSARSPAASSPVVLLNASLIGAGALTLSTSYAFGDVFGTKSSLHRSFGDAKGFYAIFAGPDRRSGRRSC